MINEKPFLRIDRIDEKYYERFGEPVCVPIAKGRHVSEPESCSASFFVGIGSLIRAEHGDY